MKDRVENVKAPRIISKEDYLKQKEEWPLPVVHLSFCDVIIGPKITKELIPLLQAMGMDMSIPTDDEYDGDEKYEDRLLKSSEMSKADMIVYGDMVNIFNGCSMTREPKIHAPQIDRETREFVSKDHSSRKKNWFYFDDLYPPDQKIITDLATDGSFEVLQPDKFRDAQEPGDDTDIDEGQDVRDTSEPTVGVGIRRDAGSGGKGKAKPDLLPFDTDGSGSGGKVKGPKV